MKIIVDAMGGDHAPHEIVRGAITAAATQKVGVVLVGRGADILRVLSDDGITDLPHGVEIANAEQVVTMDDNPATAFKDKRDSSLTVGLGLLKAGSGDAFVSAGSTGALLAGATLLVKRIHGIRRAALAPVIPTASGGAVLIDCGATAEATPEFLLQFAYMGAYYARRVMNRPSPRVGLLNIGAEQGKGTALQQDSYVLLEQAAQAGRIHFIGNVEANTALAGGADVIVADGYTGNIFLKTIEGTGKLLAGELKRMFMKNLATKIAAGLASGGIRDFKRMMDPNEVGGTALLGISKPVIKAHGSSNARAIENAIRQAVQFSNSGIVDDISAHIDDMRVTAPTLTEKKINLALDTFMKTTYDDVEANIKAPRSAENRAGCNPDPRRKG